MHSFVQKRSNVSVTQATSELLSSSACVGADCLMRLLGNYCRNQDIKTAITVGVVGKNLFFLCVCVRVNLVADSKMSPRHR